MKQLTRLRRGLMIVDIVICCAAFAAMFIALDLIVRWIQDSHVLYRESFEDQRNRMIEADVLGDRTLTDAGNTYVEKISP